MGPISAVHGENAANNYFVSDGLTSTWYYFVRKLFQKQFNKLAVPFQRYYSWWFVRQCWCRPRHTNHIICGFIRVCREMKKDVATFASLVRLLFIVELLNSMVQSRWLAVVEMRNNQIFVQLFHFVYFH